VPVRFTELDLSHYALAVIVPPLETFERDGVRPSFENLQYSHSITDQIEADYIAQGIRTVRLTANTVDGRLQELLAHARNHVRNLDKLAPKLVRA
jgi:hypothetical protein